MLHTAVFFPPITLFQHPEAEKGVGGIARVSTSVSLLPELKPAVDAFVKGGGNFSGLVNRLLLGYFKTGSDPAVVDIAVSELSDRFSAIQQEMEKLRAEMSYLHNLKVQATQEEEKKHADLLQFIEQQYNDRSEYADLRQWIRECGGKDPFTRAMKTRLSIVATKAGVSVEVAKAAIIQKYPELEEYL